MHGSLTLRSAYGDMVLEEQPGGRLVVLVTDRSEREDGQAQISLTPDDVSALRTWLDSQPPERPTVVQIMRGGPDYTAWRNRIRRAAGQHPEA